MTALTPDPIREQANALHILCNCDGCVPGVSPRSHALPSCRQIAAIETALLDARQDERRKTLEEAAEVIDSFEGSGPWELIKQMAEEIAALADLSPKKEKY